jgi:hypothetical protein
MHQEQLGIVARGRISTAFNLRVLSVGEHRRIRVEVSWVAGPILGPVILKAKRLKATRLDIDLIDQLCPGLTRHEFSYCSGHLPLRSSIPKIRIRRNDVRVIVRSLEDRRPALFEF